MEFTVEQQDAISAIQAWIHNPDRQVFYLAGYAGTGKTTLAKHLAELWGNVGFAAYTGKAAHVLRSKGCADARTIHSLIYISCAQTKNVLEALKEEISEAETHLLASESGGGTDYAARRTLAQLKTQLERFLADGAKGPAFILNPVSDLTQMDGLIVDEVSMVDDQMGEDLLSYGKKILVLGDPAQLPPVKKAEGYFTRRRPDFLLQEVHRQARESGILRLATLVRSGRPLDLGSYGEDCVVLDGARADRAQLAEAALAADQMLVGKNETRRNHNVRFRELRGLEGTFPVPGDKLVCLQNHHEIGLLNGSLWRTLACRPAANVQRVILTVAPLEDEYDYHSIHLQAHAQYFQGTEPEWFEKREQESFDYGYALTVHKAQGSQWDRVFLKDESRSFRDSWSNWLYTGITRAAKSLTIVR